MKPTVAVASFLAASVLALSACGGDGDSENGADSEAITGLVGELNRITSDRDAAGFCDVMQPSGVAANFNSRGRCIRETALILEQAGRQPTLNIEEIQVEDDRASVSLEGSAAPLALVREGGQWYVAFSDASADESGSGATGESGQEAAGSGSNGG